MRQGRDSGAVPHVLVVFGTRPEAIKMAPVVRALRARDDVRVEVCVTAQHRAMLDQVLDVFGIVPDDDLDLMAKDQTLVDLTARTLAGVSAVLKRRRPDWVLVHGDTTTTFAAALAAYYERIGVAHVEAGLRTGNRYAPWPEEMNRKLAGSLAALHFAPTETARRNLLAEGVADETIQVTGNTVIDALLQIVASVEGDPALRAAAEARLGPLTPGRRLVLVTGHRRENIGAGFESICAALARIAERGDVEIIYPVHLNPNVKGPVETRLAGRRNIRLIEPLDYVGFVWLMKRAHLILTDSGGIQEEGPALGKPVLVMREVTERPEALDAGTARLVGTDTATIVNAVHGLLDDPREYRRMATAANPFGDGRAAVRIAERLASEHARR